jgi:WXG100 family type VII secretion target
MSWQALGGNPVPGSPTVVLSVAMRLQNISGESEQLVTRLRQLQDNAGNDIWRGKAADTFRNMIAEIGPGTVQMADSYHQASEALVRFSESLRSAQGQAGRAESDAERARDERAAATAQHKAAQGEHDRYSQEYQQCKAALEEVNGLQNEALSLGDMDWYNRLVEYERETARRLAWARDGAGRAWARMQAADMARARAEAQFQAAKILACQAQELRDVAARHAVQQIDAASEPAVIRRKSITEFLSDVDDRLRGWFTSETFDEFVKLLENVAAVLAVAALVAAFFVPGGQLIAIAGFAALFGGLATAGTFFQFTYGKKTPADLLESALSVVPGLKLAKHGGKAVRRLLRSGNRQKLLTWRQESLTKVDKQIRATPLTLRPIRYFQLGNQVSEGIQDYIIEPVVTPIKVSKEISHLLGDFFREPEPHWVAFPAAGSAGAAR